MINQKSQFFSIHIQLSGPYTKPLLYDLPCAFNPRTAALLEIAHGTIRFVVTDLDDGRIVLERSFEAPGG